MARLEKRNALSTENTAVLAPSARAMVRTMTEKAARRRAKNRTAIWKSSRSEFMQRPRYSSCGGRGRHSTALQARTHARERLRRTRRLLRRTAVGLVCSYERERAEDA